MIKELYTMDSKITSKMDLLKETLIKELKESPTSKKLDNKELETLIEDILEENMDEPWNADDAMDYMTTFGYLPYKEDVIKFLEKLKPAYLEWLNSDSEDSFEKQQDDLLEEFGLGEFVEYKNEAGCRELLYRYESCDEFLKIMILEPRYGYQSDAEDFIERYLSYGVVQDVVLNSSEFKYGPYIYDEFNEEIVEDLLADY